MEGGYECLLERIYRQYRHGKIVFLPITIYRGGVQIPKTESFWGVHVVVFREITFSLRLRIWSSHWII